MAATAAEWYDPNPDLKNLYQGDVLDGVPLVYTPRKNVRWVLLRPLPQGPLENARAGLPRKYSANVEAALPSAWDRADGELVMAAAAVYRVIILSRSCILDWKKQVEVAPVYRTADLQPEALEGLRSGEDASRFYLPEDGNDIPESYADLDLKATVAVSYLRRTDHLISRLTSRATVDLQDLLAGYYARHFGFNIADQIPQKAMYRCANCFFVGMDQLQIVELDLGDNFPPCAKCGDKVLWVKIPNRQAALFD